MFSIDEDRMKDFQWYNSGLMKITDTKGRTFFVDQAKVVFKSDHYAIRIVGNPRSLRLFSNDVKLEPDTVYPKWLSKNGEAPTSLVRFASKFGFGSRIPIVDVED